MAHSKMFIISMYSTYYY